MEALVAGFVSKHVTGHEMQAETETNQLKFHLRTLLVPISLGGLWHLFPNLFWWVDR